MMLLPLEFIYEDDTIIYYKEDSDDEHSVTLVPFVLLIYSHDCNNNEILKGSADCYLNDFNLISYDHVLEDTFVIDIGYTFDEDDEDRIV